MAVTDYGMITKRVAPQEVMLSPWPGMDEMFVCRLQRPTLFQMMTLGGVPDPLLPVVEALLSGSQKKIDALDAVDSVKGVKRLAQKALIGPKYVALQEAEIELTDEQYMEIYARICGGADGIARFRGGVRDAASADDDAAKDEAEPTAED